MPKNAMNQPTRRNVLHLTGVLGLAAGISAGVGGCAPQSSDDSDGGSGKAKKDGTITAAISYELGTNGYDPMTTSAALTVAVNWHTLEGLTEIDPATQEVYAALASEMPKADGTSVDISLRDGAVFHDGTDVTVDDVVFSFERVLDPKNASLYASFIPFIKSVKKKDESTVTVTLEHPVPILAERLSVVKIVPKAAVEKDAKAFDSNPVGTGPWVMKDNGSSSKTVAFERNDDYTGPKPAKAAKMEWQIIPDAGTRTNALQSKKVQAIDSVPYLSVDQLKSGNEVESVQGFGLLFAMFNHTKGNPFAELKNRQAFLYAIDMDKVIKTGLLGEAEAATSFVQKGHPSYKKAKVVYSHDAAKAKKLFAETGLKKFRMTVTDHDWVAKCSPIIQESLKAAGVQVELVEKQSADVYNTIDGKPDGYDVLVAPGDPSVFGNDADLLMRWWYAADVWTDDRMHWKGTDSYKQVQKLLDQGIREQDEAKATKKWQETFDVISENIPLYPLFHRSVPTAWNSGSLIDFEPTSLTGLTFVDVATSK